MLAVIAVPQERRQIDTGFHFQRTHHERFSHLSTFTDNSRIVPTFLSRAYIVALKMSC